MISIIVPIYNAEKYLEECITSVLAQDFTDWELILVDDGSTDNSMSIASSYREDGKIKIICKVNEGVTLARWCGVQEASGEWLLFLDADDMLAPGALRVISSTLEYSIDILAFGFQPIKKSDDAQPASSSTIRHESYQNSLFCADKVLKGKFLSTVTHGAYKRNLLIQHKEAFCNGLKIAEDTMFNFQLVLNANPCIMVIDSRPYCYRENPASVTRAVTDARFEAVKDAIDFVRRFEKQRSRLGRQLASAFAFRKLLLWQTFMFKPHNKYYKAKLLRNEMRKAYLRAFPSLYPYLKLYLFVDLFMGTRLSQKLIKGR